MRAGTGIAAAVLGAGLLLVQTPMAAEAADGSATQTDVDFVRRVHATVLGLTPASALAKDMGASAAVKALAARVGGEEAKLDQLTRGTATALKVSLDAPLPAGQQAGLAELQQHSGTVFDQQYVTFLWNVDSALLPIATTVRATTKNAAVRTLAERADTVTAGQLPLLQKSGLLKMPMVAAASASAAAKLPGGVPLNSSLVARARAGSDGGLLSATFRVRLIVLAVAVCVAGALTWRLVARSTPRGRRRTRRTPVEAPPPSPAVRSAGHEEAVRRR